MIAQKMGVHKPEVQSSHRVHREATQSVVSVVSEDSADSVVSEDSVGKGREASLPKAVVTAAIEDSLPRAGSGDDLRGCMFRLARMLRAHRATAGVGPARLRKFCDMWHKRAVEAGHSDWSAELVFFCFEEVWGGVKFAAGTDVVAECAAKVSEASLPACAARFADSRTRYLVGLCHELQRVHGDGPFYLSCRDAGRMLGIGHKEAALLLRVLADEARGDVLRVVERPSRGKLKAIRYQFVGEV